MAETLLLTLVCFGFVVVSLALAFSFGMNAYLDWQSQQVAIDHGIVLKHEQEEGEDDDNSTD